MDLIIATRQKVDSALALIENLKASAFPHPDSEAALREIEVIFQLLRQDADRLDSLSDWGTVTVFSQAVSGVLQDYLPFLGHIQHSKNASNAFELYQPLLRLARKVINDDNIGLILSSEWDLSPFTLITSTLDSFVWVGLPASESSNALLAPLAGHELGHSVWDREKYKARYQPDLEELIIKELVAESGKYQELFGETADEKSLLEKFSLLLQWSPALEWALRQSEEVFCDLLGLRLFGESYLHAFAYLLAPGGNERTTPDYPSLRKRAEYLASACPTLGVSVPTGYVALFQEVEEADGIDAFLAEIAERATERILEELIRDANVVASSRGIPATDEAEVKRVMASVSRLVPYDGDTSLGAILTAGWRASFDPHLWSDYPQLADRRGIVLNELLLKCAQVLEYNTRVES